MQVTARFGVRLECLFDVSVMVPNVEFLGIRSMCGIQGLSEKSVPLDMN